MSSRSGADSSPESAPVAPTKGAEELLADPEEADLRQQLLGLMEQRALAPLLEATLAFQARFPTQAWGWLISVPTYIDLGRYDRAKAALRQAEALSDDSVRGTLCYWYSVLYKEQGELKRAQKWIKRALKRAPEEGAYWVTLGAILMKRGRLKAARKANQTALTVNTADAEEALVNLALLARAKRRYAEALKYVQQALAIDPDYAEAHALRHDLEAVLRGDW